MLYIPNLLLLLVKRIWVFFFISAYLLGMKEIHKSNVLSFLKKKTLVIFVPFLSWTFLVKPLFFIDEFLQEVPGGLSILKQISGKLNLLRINNNGEHEAINVRMDISKQDENYEIHLSIEDVGCADLNYIETGIYPLMFLPTYLIWDNADNPDFGEQ